MDECIKGICCRPVGRFECTLGRLEIIIPSAYIDHFYGIPVYWIFNYDACKKWKSL